MSIPYNGTAGSANFALAPILPVDGENFNFATFIQAVVEPTLDRIAWLYQHSAIIDQANTFSGTNTFDGTVNIGDGTSTPTLHVKNGATAHIDSGGSFTAASGSNVTISSPGLGNVNITADSITALFTSPTSPALDVQGPMYQDGPHAVHYVRTPTDVSVSGHVDCTEDVWRVADTLSANITIQVDAPPDNTKATFLTIVRGPQADANQVTMQQGTGTGGAVGQTFAVGNETGHHLFTEYDGIGTSGRWTAYLIWSPGLGLWRILSLSGAVVPASGAE